MVLAQSLTPTPWWVQGALVGVVLSVLAGIVFGVVKVWRAIFRPALDEAVAVSEKYSDLSTKHDLLAARERRCQRNLSNLASVMATNGIQIPERIWKDINDRELDE